MDNKEFNEQRHNRKKQQYRFILGIQQLWNYPLLNLIGRLFAGGVVFLVMAKSKYIASVEVYSMFETIFTVCTTAIIIIFPIICAIGIVQLVGFLFAIRDEADMEIVFGDKRDVKNQPPILIFKKKIENRESLKENSILLFRWNDGRKRRRLSVTDWMCIL